MESFLTDLIKSSHEELMTTDPDDLFSGYAYLRGRGVTEEQMKLFQIGVGPSEAWAPHKLRKTPDGKMFNRQFRGTMEGQITFPVWNSSGVLRGVETRLWEETQFRKYTQYWLESWQEDSTFLGCPAALESIWETGVVYLVEGMFDFFPVQRVFPNTLCTLTAKVTEAQQRFLKRYCKHVVFMFDMDQKGKEISGKSLDKYNVSNNRGFSAHQLIYPAKDPGELYEKWGIVRFDKYLKRKADSFNLYL